jgi:NAD(P)-dependent dehydrogenase (short-subunit alcohol dehydrogenase family)
MEKVWLITGCSTGFGRELALQVLAKGYKVAVASLHKQCLILVKLMCL